MPTPRSSNRTALVVLAAGLACTLLASWLLERANTRHVDDALSAATERAAKAVTTRIELYQYGLRGARGAILTGGEWGISREQFINYARTRDEDIEFPGARGFGFIRRVPMEQEADFIARARADGVPDFSVRQLTPHDDERYIIEYVEPVDRNRQAIGLDIASETNRRTAALAALTSGEVRLTGPITLVQATGKPLQSFLILLPIYRTAATPDTVEARLREGYGWSYAPLLTEEVLSGLQLQLEGQGLQIHLSDVTDASEPVAFYHGNPPAAGLDPRLLQRVEREVYGRHWQIELSAGPTFVAAQGVISPWLIASAGVLASLLLAALTSALQLNRYRHRQLQSQQARLAAIVNSSADAIIGQSLDGHVVSWNRGAEQIFGYSADQAVGRSLLELIVPSQSTAEEQAIQLRIARGEQVNHFQARRRHRDGHLIDVSCSVAPLLDNSGQLSGISSTLRDISAQKAAETRILELNANLEGQVSERTRELRELNVLLNNVLQSASEVSIIATDTQGVIQLFNRGAENLLGYRAEQMIGVQTPAIIHAPEEIEARSRELSREYGEPIEGFRVFVHKPEREGAESRQWTYVRQDGSRTTVTLVVTAMRDADSGLVGYLGIALDMSEELRLSRETMAARDQLELAAEVAELGIWSWTPDSGQLQWNDRMLELYDYSRAEYEQGLTYAHWRARLLPEDADALEHRLQQAVRGEADFDMEFRVIKSSGKVLHIQAKAQVERDADGQPVSVIGINRDITEQLEQQAHLREAKEQADAANEAKSAFLANMSHEIRTPMNAVLGMLKLVQGTGLNPRQLDYVLKALGAAHSLLGLLNDILDYSKIEAGKLDLDLHDFELEPLLRDLAVVLAGNQGEKDLEVLFDIDSSLPTVVHGDSLRLQQVLINLSGNALKFTEHGQVIVSLQQLGRTHDHVQLRIAVSDTGIGISQEQQQHIFDGFTQAEASTTRRFGGTGLGLVICKRLVELMGGELQVESQPGQGSRFWFDLELAIASPRSVQDSAREQLRDQHLLVVDDNPIALQMLQQMVIELGWQADVARSGAEAIGRVLQKQPPYDAVLMDWRMPEMDGLEAARLIQDAVRDRVPQFTIIMVTAHGREVLAEQHSTGHAPFASFLTKPITAQQLVSSLLRAEQNDPDEPAPRIEQAPRRLQGLRLLVVEDNALNRQVASELLAGEGAEVALAEGGLEGVRQALSEPAFDAVLMDIQMPDIDGLEATRRIRAAGNRSTLPIIAMTANASQTDKDACLQAGMDDHVGKPVDLEKLVTVILRHCSDQPAQPTSPASTDAGQESPDALLSRFGGKLTLLRSMLSVFPAQTRKLVAELQEFADAANIDAILQHLHTLKGSSGTMGAGALSRRCAELEEAFQKAPDSALAEPGWIDELYAELDRSVQRLQAEVTALEQRLQ
ncbi:hybrid sensor histidine kinase/response regulator [Pseudomonas abyssi]|uniref:histidine kinase n=1 Tax=Pseudomonas abyssi TaxID=170540 RepID=A0A2A3MFV4_9PSED|nr:PAS domain S-box protein [Pseudomonas abyssi]MAC99076.1 hybrid sensor histidine kinase/response regulator [Pseudomonadales bacterium]PBK03434.1 hybrid sensor histidine kinase/response regulator [Pseudomonas abyssi]|tara:strand:+ start:25719 stop:29954 length:4236 start_codon:yes stop_codon:yes gene_type:complete